MAAPKKKKLTQREKALNARVKKQLQEEGVLPRISRNSTARSSRRKSLKNGERWTLTEASSIYRGRSVAWYRRTCERLTLNKSGFSNS